MSASFTSQVRKCASPAAIEREIRRMHAGMAITRDQNVSVVKGFVKDIEWNAMDVWHRVWVHNTYLEHMQVFSGRDFSINVTRLGKLPCFSQVVNVKVAPGLIYQTMVLWGVFFIYQVVELEQLEERTRITVTWYLCSHRLFKLLHRPLNWRLSKLQKVQDEEDEEIRDRRYVLRKAGVRFDTDDFDFLNSNDLGDHARMPALERPVRIPLTGLAPGEVRRYVEGTVELMVERSGDAVKVWPGMCPHAGAELRPEHVCRGAAECSWHGRKFPAKHLSPAQPVCEVLGRRVELQGDALVVESADAPVPSSV